jgi:hypothetical protein
VVHAGDAAPIAASPVNADLAPRESGLRRLTKAISFMLAMLCVLVLGAIGGGYGGAWLAFQAGFLGYILLWVTCPAGGFFGLWLAKGLGQGFARLLSSYRLALWGLVLGITGGVFYFSQTVEDPDVQILAGQMGLEHWLTLSLAAAIGGLAVGLATMILDAITNFTR